MAPAPLDNPDRVQPNATLDSILKRVEELEKRVESLVKDLEDVKDIQLVEKMDIVNLKNEIESIEMTSPQISRGREETRSIEELTEELKDMREHLVSGGMGVCRSCGSAMPKGAAYCGKCGGKL
jgi:regulator of replication initiation timing